MGLSVLLVMGGFEFRIGSGVYVWDSRCNFSFFRGIWILEILGRGFIVFSFISIIKVFVYLSFYVDVDFV